MSDEKKGAVLTGEIARDSDLVEVPPGPALIVTLPVDVYERLVASARLARLAAELFEEYGASIAAVVSSDARRRRDLYGDFTTANMIDRAHAALESTIAAFRKGAE
jgi:hypothetical protein